MIKSAEYEFQIECFKELLKKLILKIEIWDYFSLIFKNESFEEIFPFNNGNSMEIIDKEILKTMFLEREMNKSVDLHPKLLETLEILHEYFAESVLFEKSECYSSLSMKKFIIAMKCLNDLTETRMRRTLKIQKMNEMKMRNREKDMQRALMEVERLRLDLTEEKMRFESVADAINKKIARGELTVATIRANSQQLLSDEIEKSECEISTSNMKIKETKTALLIEKDRKEKEFQLICTQILDKEKQLLLKRIQIEEQCTSLISKYDNDVGKYYSLLKLLTKELSDLCNQLKSMKERLVDHRILYEDLKKEREIAIMRIFAKQLENLQRNHAAKVIQKAWRIYFERISMKRKKKLRKKENKS